MNPLRNLKSGSFVKKHLILLLEFHGNKTKLNEKTENTFTQQKLITIGEC